MATITSGIPGDINQAKRRPSPTSPDGIQQLTRQALQPQSATTSIAQVDNSRPSPMLPGDPARAARMQAQMDQPVTKVDQGPSTGDRLTQIAKDAYAISKPLLMPAATVGGILGAPVIDAGRNALIRAAGGDPKTAEGGDTKYQDRAFDEIQPAVQAFQTAGDAARRGAGGAILSITGASPAQAASPAAGGGGVTGSTPDKPSLPAVPKPSSGPAAPAGNGYQGTGIAGVVGRRGANGVMEFTNDATAVKGAQGQLAGYGDGKGTLSIISGGQEGMQRNLRAAEIMQQTRRANAGSGLTIVADSGAHDRAVRTASITGQPLQGQMRAEGKAVADGRGGALAQPPEDYSEANRSLAASDAANLQVSAARRNDEAQQRVQSVLASLTDPSTPAAEREQLQRTYATLTTPAKDRYVLQDTVLGYDDTSQKPILGRIALDTTTGQPVSGGVGAAARPGAQQQRQVGTVYRDANGNRATFQGYDAQGNEKWGSA
ncbi:TPA: hypothetical protein ACGSTW_000674 [Pseudomonas aeruginosa]